MATNSIRVDDRVKKEASEIAAQLGLTYNSIINVFLREFVRQKGFPFQVQLPKEEPDVFSMDSDEITAIVEKSVSGRSDIAAMPYTTARNLKTGKLYKHFTDGHIEEV